MGDWRSRWCSLGTLETGNDRLGMGFRHKWWTIISEVGVMGHRGYGECRGKYVEIFILAEIKRTSTFLGRSNQGYHRLDFKISVAELTRKRNSKLELRL